MPENKENTDISSSPDDVLGDGSAASYASDNPQPPASGAPQHSEQQNTVLTNFNAASFDEAGNALMANGNVALTKEQVQEEITKLSNPPANNDNPTELSLEDKNLLAEYKGSSFDDKGNILDESGAIVTTVEQLEEDKDIFNQSGDLVDKQGNILEKAEDYDNRIAAEENNDFFEGFVKKVGITPLDERGNAVEYSPDDEGMLHYVADSLATSNRAAVSNYHNNLPQDVQDLNEFISRGGKIDDFFVKEDNWSEVELPSNNEELRNIIITNQRALGNTAEMATRFADYAESADKLKEDGKMALDQLKVRDTNTRDAKLEALRQEDAASEVSRNEYWTGVKDTVISKGVLDGVTIPIAERDDFFDFVSKPVDSNGNSAAVLAENGYTPEQRLLMDYLFLYKKKNPKEIINQLVNHAQATNKISISRKNKQSNQRRVSNNGRVARRSQVGQLDNNPDTIL